jgi:uncharacterized protein
VLELRGNCEHCGRDLPPDAAEAMICTFECTFFAECATSVLSGICPNCTGNFSPRPIRPASRLRHRPASTERVFKPVDLVEHAERVATLGGVAPAER